MIALKILYLTVMVQRYFITAEQKFLRSLYT